MALFERPHSDDLCIPRGKYRRLSGVLMLFVHDGHAEGGPGFHADFGDPNHSLPARAVERCKLVRNALDLQD